MSPRKRDPLSRIKKITVKSGVSDGAAGKRVAGQIVDQMRSIIFAGMQPGDWIGTEAELADRFGVSKVAIRAAIQTLRAYGLIAVKVGSGGGLSVAREDPAHLAEALAVQLHLLDVEWEEAIEATAAFEPTLASLAAVRRTEDHLTSMRALLDEAPSLTERRAAFQHNSAEFHIAIAEAAGNRALLVAAKAFRLNQENHPLAGNDLRAIAASITAEHEAIYQAIASKDADRAEKLMTAHNRDLAMFRGRDGNSPPPWAAAPATKRTGRSKAALGTVVSTKAAPTRQQRAAASSEMTTSVKRTARTTASARRSAAATTLTTPASGAVKNLKARTR